MMNYGMQEADAVTAGGFIRACLHLDPDERASVGQLVEHPWMDMCYG